MNKVGSLVLLNKPQVWLLINELSYGIHLISGSECYIHCVIGLKQQVMNHTKIQNWQIGVLLQHRGLRIQHCHCRGLGSCCGKDPIPGLGTSTYCRCGKKKKKKKKQEFLSWLSGLGTLLVSVRMQVWSLDLLSRLRIQHCCELWCRSQTWLGSGIAVAVA